MPENVEIKAVATDFDAQFDVAKNISDRPGTVLKQKDTFYKCSTGRLKLRMFDEFSGDLIAYHRVDSVESTQSSYKIYSTSTPEDLALTLGHTLEVIGIVSKTRHLFFSGQTRIHIDQVEGLGKFIEFEYVLEPGEDKANGHNALARLMETFSIAEDDLISRAYIDLLLSKN